MWDVSVEKKSGKEKRELRIHSVFAVCPFVGSLGRRISVFAAMKWWEKIQMFWEIVWEIAQTEFHQFIEMKTHFDDSVNHRI